MESVTNSMKSAASAMSKGAASTASAVTKSASSTASTITKGATSTASAVTKGASSVTKGATSAVSKTSSAVSKALPSFNERESMTTERVSSARSVRNVIEPTANGMIKGLMEHRVTAVVKDLDHYRKHGLVAVETDYIIHVKCLTSEGNPDFGFVLSKTFSAFRALANSLYAEAEDVMFSSANLPKKITQLAKYCHAVLQLIESQSTEYLGKINYSHVQTLAKQRSQIINDFLDATMTNFPELSTVERQPFARKVAILIEKFFLTDHCESVEGEGDEDIFGTLVNQPIRKNYHTVENPAASTTTKEDEADDGMDVSVVPHSKKERRSKETRETEEKELAKSKETFKMDEDSQKQSKAVVGKRAKSSPIVSIVTLVNEKPIVALAAFAGAMQVFRAVGLKPVTLDIDVILVLAFASFCLGMQAPRMLGIQHGASVSGKDGAATLSKQSIMASSRGGMAAADADGEETANVTIQSPMPRFPEGAKLGSVLNCWSDPPAANFNVRGDNYLSDKKKIKSGPFLFQTRGIDLFLTDLSPENVGRIPSLMGGELRSVPTFIINFRLPWGVLLFYFEIPERFVPYIKGCYGEESYSKDVLEASMKEMSNPDRCCARFLLGDDTHKNNTLKIFPAVVEGPWVVKASIGGKPAIIGTKLPVNYVYQPEGQAVDGSKQALYLEADLDVVSNSTARGILSLVRSCTQELTLDLGFAIQGNSDDELPEQMLTGTRVHGIDAPNAPPLPPLTENLFAASGGGGDDDDDDDSETEGDK